MSDLTRKDFLKTAGVAAAGLGLTACGGSSSSSTTAATTSATTEDPVGADPELVAAAQEEGELVVYGSCEEAHVQACCTHFEELYGITTTFQRLSTGEVQAKIEEEAGNPSADVWFGGTTDPYNEATRDGLLEPYDAKNKTHILKDKYMDADGNWYGIYTGLLGMFWNTDEMERLGLDTPTDFTDLTDEKYQGLIWLSNYNTAGTAKLFLNTMIQKLGHDEAMEYLVALDKNIAVYTKSGSGPSKNVGTGECTIGIGFLHDAIYQIVDNGYGNIGMTLPASGASSEVGATAIFKGCTHPNAAKLWIEYALSPECVERAAEVGAYQFLVIDDAEQPAVAIEYGLDPDNVMDYDFEDAKENTSQYVEDVMAALGGGDDRFQTE